MESNAPIVVNLVPFVHCQSYRLVRVKLDPPENVGQDLEGICRIVLTSKCARKPVQVEREGVGGTRCTV